MRTIVITLGSVGGVLLLVGIVLGVNHLRMQKKADVALVTDPGAPAAVPTPTGTSTGASVAPKAAIPSSQPTRPPETQPGDGSTILFASTARLHGFRIRLEPKPDPHVAFWVDQQEFIEWPHGCPRAGKYDVEVTYSCANEAGGNYVLSVGGTPLRANSAATGGWDKYRTIKAGTLTLGSDRMSLTIKPEGDPRYALMNLRSVRFIPVKQ